MTANDLKEWAASLPPDAQIELMLHEVAKVHGYNNYDVTESEVRRGAGWVELEAATLRAKQDHPLRRPSQVAERLLK